MTRPITLFTGQWADLPFEEVARLAGEWGFDGRRPGATANPKGYAAGQRRP